MPRLPPRCVQRLHGRPSRFIPSLPSLPYPAPPCDGGARQLGPGASSTTTEPATAATVTGSAHLCIGTSVPALGPLDLGRLVAIASAGPAYAVFPGGAVQRSGATVQAGQDRTGAGTTPGPPSARPIGPGRVVLVLVLVVIASGPQEARSGLRAGSAGRSEPRAAAAGSGPALGPPPRPPWCSQPRPARCSEVDPYTLGRSTSASSAARSSPVALVVAPRLPQVALWLPYLVAHITAGQRQGCPGCPRRTHLRARQPVALGP